MALKGIGSQVCIRVGLFLIFVVLARQFFALFEIDGCLDDGGAVRDGVCVESRHGQWSLASERPLLGWFISLGIPALIVWAFYFYALRIRLAKHER